MGGGSNGQPIHIWVDDREARGSRLAARLAGLEDVSVTVKRLRTGDYLIEGKAVLERNAPSVSWITSAPWNRWWRRTPKS